MREKDRKTDHTGFFCANVLVAKKLVVVTFVGKKDTSVLGRRPFRRHSHTASCLRPFPLRILIFITGPSSEMLMLMLQRKRFESERKKKDNTTLGAKETSPRAHHVFLHCLDYPQLGKQRLLIFPPGKLRPRKRRED